MKVNVGDKVKFLNDVGGGKITRIDNKIVFVENEDGFEIPVSVHEIVVTQESEAEIPEEKQNQVVKKSTVNTISANTKQDCNVLLAVSPENPEKASISDLKLYLVNDSGYALLYACFIDDSKGYTHLKSGIVEPNTKILLKKLFQSEISKLKHIKLQAIFSGNGAFQPKDPINREIAMAAYTFYKQNTYTNNEYFNNNALIINVLDYTIESYGLENNNLKVIAQKKEKEETKKQFNTPKPTTDILEVDLHIHELLDDYRGLSNTEMLEIQMKQFRNKLQEAKQGGKVKKVVFIHGLGNGTLKREICNELDRKHKNLVYQDASFKEYGFGATLVYLQK